MNLGGNHPLEGRSAPNFAFTDGTKLGDLLRSGKGLLLDFEPNSLLKSVAARWSHQITYVASDVEDNRGLTSVLIRPDGVVAWITEGAPYEEEVAAATAKWFGTGA